MALRISGLQASCRREENFNKPINSVRAHMMLRMVLKFSVFEIIGN
jgi:hypothetical protein